MTYLNNSLTSILDALPVGAALLDPTDRVLFVNRSLDQWLGPVVQGWVGQPWATCWASLDAGQDGDELQIGGRFLRHHRAALGDQAQVVIFEDITELRVCEDGLREMFIVWDEASAFHAHELRNPLTAILGFGSLLRDRPTATEEKRREWAGRTVEKAQAMRESIELYSTTSRFLTERHRFHRSALNLAHLVEDAVHGGGIPAPTLPDAPCWVNGDADRLRRLVGILLDYSRHQARGADAVRVRLTVEEGHAVLRVSDGGRPVSAEVQAAIFEPLHPHNGMSGSRVELTIARGLASAHGGALEFAPQPQVGNTFTLILPALSDQDIPPGSATHA